MQIVGGTISFEDGVKKAEDYAPAKKARVELRFDVAEGADVDMAIEYVRKACVEKVYAMLGVNAASAVAQEPAKRGRPPKEKAVAAEHEEAVAGVTKTAETISDKEKLATAAGLAPAFPEYKTAPDPAAMGDELDDILGEVEEPPVTDADLNSAVQTKNREIKNHMRIRGVIWNYNGGPGKVIANIPQEKRQQFLKELSLLKPE